MEEITNNAIAEEQEEIKTFTAEEVEKMIDSRISKAYVKWDKEKNKAVEKAKSLAEMSEAERQTEHIKELETKAAEYERKIAVMENTKVCLEECSKRNIPAEFNQFIVCDDADVMLERLNTFEKTLKKMINEEVKKKLPSTVVEKGSVDINKITKEQFNSMTLSEQNRIFNENKELYMQLTK